MKNPDRNVIYFEYNKFGRRYTQTRESPYKAELSPK